MNIWYRSLFPLRGKLAHKGRSGNRRRRLKTPDCDGLGGRGMFGGVFRWKRNIPWRWCLLEEGFILFSPPPLKKYFPNYKKIRAKHKARRKRVPEEGYHNHATITSQRWVCRLGVRKAKARRVPKPARQDCLWKRAAKRARQWAWAPATEGSPRRGRRLNGAYTTNQARPSGRYIILPTQPEKP